MNLNQWMWMGALALQAACAANRSQPATVSERADERAPLVVDVTGPEVLVGGQQARATVRELHQAITRRLGASRRSVVIQAPEGESPALHTALQACRAAALTQLSLRVGARTVDVPITPPLSGDYEGNLTLAWRGSGPVLRASKEAPHEQKADGAQTQAPIPPQVQEVDARDDAGRTRLAQTHCESKCLLMPRITKAVSGAALVQIATWAAGLRSKQPNLEVEWLFEYEDEATEGDQPQARVRYFGRLAPEEIQSVVRAGFSHLKSCFKQGLARNPALSGTVRTFFLIDRDGSVSDVTDGGSNLPDLAVRACVLGRFYDLRFPRPEGGIVYVNYPLKLEP